MRRARRRHDSEPIPRALAKGAAVALVLGVFGWIAVSAYNGVPGRDYRTLYVDVAHAGNLLPHDQVRIAGVRVGQVQKKTITAGGGVRLELQLEPDVSLPADTAVALRASGLLGARFVELVPGRSPRSLPTGATIRVPGEALTYGVPEALDTFDAQTRGGLGTTVRELGGAMLGNGTRLNDAVRLSSEHMERFQLLTERVMERPDAVARLLPSLDRGLGALDASREEIGELLPVAADAFAPFADERTAVRSVLDQAPGALTAAGAGLSDGRRLLQSVRALTTEARRTLPAAPAGLRRANRLLRESRAPLGRATALLRAAHPAIPAALRLTSAASPVLKPLRTVLEDVVPLLERIGLHGCDIANFGAVFRSMTGLGGTGEGPNGPAMSFRLQVIPPSVGEVTGTADGSGLVVRDGYPEPCRYLASEYPAVNP